MRRFVSKREIIRRLERVEALLAQPTPAPLAGQQAAFSVATIGHHTFEGPGLHCRADLFGQTCGEHRDAHQHLEDRRA
ncbi:hypothetical protein [Streptomyces leeuwenhoekii]|uniref:Sle1_086 protein n=1 Tax=Streptomyces leeuwenhoekii TaxID=1437453 RepID=A0A0F7VMF6_STRLW|nr:hypothetical protein [Streptomyces leeuwenhoekii]CQR59253.1 sle1_086 [Streptomyces leeuwenhoekii]